MCTLLLSLFFVTMSSSSAAAAMSQSSYYINARERNNNIHNHIFPPIHLDPSKNYEVACVRLSFYNKFQNVTSFDNKLYYYDHNRLPDLLIIESIPPGVYTAATLFEEINKLIPPNRLIFQQFNDKCKIFVDDIELQFTQDDSIFSHLGFLPTSKPTRTKTSSSDNSPVPSADPILAANRWQAIYEGDDRIKLFDSTEYFLTSNLVSHSYFNQTSCRILYNFVMDSSRNNCTHDERIFTPIYVPLPVCLHNTITDVCLSLMDANQRLVDVNGQYLSVSLHIREVK